MDLLCVQHAHGFITRDDIIDICGLYDEKIARKFPIEFEPGRFQNERLRDEKLKRQKYADHQRDNANKRWKKNESDDSNDDAMALPTQCDGIANAMHLGNGNGNINRFNNKKKVSEKIEKPKPEIKINYPWDSVDFKNIWSTWIEYKRQQHKFKYKSPVSINSALKMLNTFAGGDEKFAIYMLEYAIGRGWQFPVNPNDHKYNYGKIDQTNNGGQRNDAETGKPGSHYYGENAVKF